MLIWQVLKEKYRCPVYLRPVVHRKQIINGGYERNYKEIEIISTLSLQELQQRYNAAVPVPKDVQFVELHGIMDKNTHQYKKIEIRPVRL